MSQISRKEFLTLYRQFLSHEGKVINAETKLQLKQDLRTLNQNEGATLDNIAKSLRVAMIAHREISLQHHSIQAILLYTSLYSTTLSAQYITEHYDNQTAIIIEDLVKGHSLYERNVSVESENFRKLLLSLAQDVRVIMIMIAEKLDTMRHLDNYTIDDQQKIAREVSFLYAPLAHRMGLYTIKTELEDLSLKYTSREIYNDIAKQLKETKRSRESYIKNFIEPVKERLDISNYKCNIKGRTKSIHSIYNKMRKQQVPFTKVYDLFAIRIIVDCPVELEKAACWYAFSVITDMYTPNTNRLRDWISMPKSNGYESLHITVMGPEGKWVEVQIRTRRMDEIAEKGMAAHWKYKGGKSDSAQSDEWLKNLRDMLEQNSASSGTEVMDEFKMQLYDDDVFVFTPKGDLHRLHKGASVLDFAFSIHTKLGYSCMGANVNGKHMTFKYKLQNGDQVEILTSPNQTPKADWLNWAQSSKARTSIKQALKEIENREAALGREIFERRMKNWKIETNDSDLFRSAKKMGYKNLTEFFVAINQEKINLLAFRDTLAKINEPQVDQNINIRTTEGFEQETELQKISNKDDALIIDNSLKNVDYTLARCCNPIYGDEIFGFVSVSDGIKIHRKNCPNAPEMISRYGYRIVNAKWSGNTNSEYTTTLCIIGRDDIAIVSNITSFISKESGVLLRSISVETKEGLFEGNITIKLNQLNQLNQLIKKLKTIKGIKQIYRI